jgi:hypothetical protein
MRNRLMSVTAALLLASATFAMAQAPAPAEKGSAAAPVSGTIDVGYRATSVTGDEARYERYRDLRDGAYTDIVLGKETGTYLFNLTAKNAGYRDQRFTLDYANAKVKFGFIWDATPLNYGYNTLTPWTETSGNVWTLDAASRTLVQNKAAMGIPTTYAQAQNASIYRALAKPFDIQQRRDNAGVNMSYDASKDLALSLTFNSTHKTGYQPFGMAFAFNNANELPMQLDNRTNDFGVAVEWVKPQGMFRAAVDYSSFSNEYNEVMWDNPLRATDFNNGLTPPSGPYDASGYSNGNGPARGRISSFPDSTMTVVSFMGLYKMAHRTSLNGSLQVINQNQDDQLIPWTTNSVINQQAVWDLFPNLKTLPRETAEAKVRAVNALLNFTSRPTRTLGFNVKYRHNTHANISRPFPYAENVRFDAVPEESDTESEGHTIVRDTVDATMSVNVLPQTTLRLGYGYDNFNRTGRAHNDMRDNAFRATIDTVGNQYVSLRAGYEYVQRKGFGFSEMAIEDGGAQPGLRFYDEAERDRNRGSLVLTLTPISVLDLTGSVAYGKDEYGGPGLEFGLLNNKNTSYNVGANLSPMPTVSLGVNYGRDTFNALQKSRNANPAPDPQWTDASRDWTLTNDEQVNNVDVFVDLLKAIQKTDIRLAYSMSDSDNSFLHGGPRIASLAATTDAVNGVKTFAALPNVTNKWQQFSADVKVFATRKLGFAVAYYYEKLDITDFATINLPGTDQPRIDYLGGLTTGYGNRPYKGSTGVFRILYTF